MAQPIRDHALESFSEETANVIEDKLWWVRGRKHIIREYLRAANAIAPTQRIIDIGCGSGGNLDVLAEFGRVTAVDRSDTLAARARRRNIATAVYSSEVFEMQETADIFTLFDVLEHIEDDTQFLLRLRSIARARHLLLVSVPACQWLFSAHDELLHHYRRYSKQSLRRVLMNAGYVTLRSGYFMSCLFPLAVGSRYVEKTAAFFGRKQAEVSIGAVPGWLGNVLTRLLQTEAILSRLVTFPVGLWLFALATPSGQGVGHTQ
jgi:SAM-dependent methyltransferase